MPRNRSSSVLRLTLQVLALALVVALIGLLAFRLLENDEAKGIAAALDRGETPPAPSFSLPRLDQTGELSLASLKGKVVVINFWASWCLPCREEAPLFEAAWNEWRSRGVVIVGVNAQDFETDARRFMRRYAMTYPVVHDGPGSILGRYGVTGFPETFFIDRDGNLVGERIQGQVTASALRTNIANALRGSTG